MFFIIAAVPERADAHGLGGLNASSSTAAITSITPSARDFSLTTIENGERIRLTRLSNTTIYVIGVDGEKYLQFTEDGVFENEKSSTRIINQSKSRTQSVDELYQEFASTSANPDAPPVWKKISSSNQYSWHDHRAHFMGTVPDGVTQLGTSSLFIEAGSVKYTVTVSFNSGAVPLRWLPFVIVGLCAAILIYALTQFKDYVVAHISRYTCAIILCLLAIIELAHIIGYIQFSQGSLSSEMSASLYSAIVIVLCIASAFSLYRSREMPWRNALSRHAPLFSLTGLCGFAAGFALEYKALLDPFPASAQSSGVIRTALTVGACLSLVIFFLGFCHIKSSSTLRAKQ